MSSAERPMKSRSSGSPESVSTEGTNASHSASRVARWVSSNTAAATAMPSPP